jgi:fumarate hydratase class I
MSVGIGGTAEKALLIAKEALNEPINMSDLLSAGPQNKTEELRIELYERLNALGVGAQGLGGVTTVVDVKVSSHPCHAASKPVALVPQCAANRHISFLLDGRGKAVFLNPNLSAWPKIEGLYQQHSRQINVDTVSREELQNVSAGEQVLLSGTIYTARDAAHKRIVEYLNRGEPLPVNLKDKFIYYVGPVKAVGDEVVGPSGPTTSSRMDGFIERMLNDVGIMGMVGKAERGASAVQLINQFSAPYFVAVCGAA